MYYGSGTEAQYSEPITPDVLGGLAGSRRTQLAAGIMTAIMNV